MTHAVSLACLGVFLVTYLPSRATIAESEAKVKQAAYYFVGHPYLSAEPRLLTAVGQRIAKEARAAYLAEREQSGAGALPESELRHHQAKLEAMLVQADGLLAALPYGDWGVVPARFDRRTLATYAFLHGSWLQLSIVALFVLLLGSALEGAWGRPLYAALLAGSTLAAGTWYALELPQVEIPLIGGSGLAAGLLGAFLVAFWGRREDFIYGVGTIAGLFWLAIPLWAGDRFFAPPGERGSLGLSPPSLVQWAHLGGFLFGAGLALVVRWADARRRSPRQSVEKRLARGSEAVRDRALLDRAMRARRSGELAESFALLRQVLKIQPNHLEASRALWDVAVALDKAPEGAPALITALRHEVRVQDSDAAVRHWLELLDYAGGTEIEATLLIPIACFVQTAGHPVEAREALRRALRDPMARSSSILALGIVERARGLDPELTLEAARIARRLDGIGDEQREGLERLIHELEFGGTDPESANLEPSEPDLDGAALDGGISEAIFGSSTPEPRGDESPLVDLTSELADETPHEPEEPADRVYAEPIETESEPDPDEDTASEPTPQAEPEADPNDDTLSEMTPTAHSKEASDPLAERAAAERERARAAAAAEGGEAREARPSQRRAPARAAPGVAYSVRPPRRLKVVEAVPVELMRDALHIRVKGRGSRKVPLARIEAISVVAVHKLREKPVVLVDLAINWSSPATERMNLIRLRGDQFDPRRLAKGFESPLAALRNFAERLLRETGAEPIPDEGSARGLPFAVFPDLATYQRVVLSASE